MQTYPFADIALARRLERAEATSNARFVELRDGIDPGRGACWLDVGGTYAMFDGPSSPVTQTFGLGMFQAPTADDFDRLERFFFERGAPADHEVSPQADPAALGLLVERGYRPFEFTSVMFRPVGVSPAKAGHYVPSRDDDGDDPGVRSVRLQPDLHSGERGVGLQPDLHSGERSVRLQPDLHSGERSVGLQPDLHSGERGVGLQPDLHSGERGVGLQPDLHSGVRSVRLQPDLHVRVISADEADLWAKTASAGWGAVGGDFMLDVARVNAGAPDGHLFLAELDGRPIATAALAIHDGVAHFAGASTIPEGRRNGAQLALLDARMRHAAAHGCDLALMGAAPGSGSQRNAERHGFRIAYTRIKWRRRG